MTSVDHYGLLRRAATEAGFTETETATFAELLRFSIWTHQQDNGEIVAHPGELPAGRPADLLVGRAGGLPQLPAGTPWPTDPEGHPLPFIASFDCAALPRVERLPLPSDGSLLVLLHHEEDYDVCERSDKQQYGRLLHVRAGTGTTAQLPADHAAHPYYKDRDFIAPEQDLLAVVHADLPSWLTVELRGSLTSVDRAEEAFLVEQELQRVRREWLPLVQFRTRDDVYFGRFMIRVDDLAAQRFDRAVSWTEFTE